MVPLDKEFQWMNAEAVAWRSSVKKLFLKVSRNLQENTGARASFLIKLQPEASNFINKETVAQVFSSEFCEIFKNTFSYRTILVAASENKSHSDKFRHIQP